MLISYWTNMNINRGEKIRKVHYRWLGQNIPVMYKSGVRSHQPAVLTKQNTKDCEMFNYKFLNHQHVKFNYGFQV